MKSSSATTKKASNKGSNSSPRSLAQWHRGTATYTAPQPASNINRPCSSDIQYKSPINSSMTPVQWHLNKQASARPQLTAQTDTVTQAASKESAKPRTVDINCNCSTACPEEAITLLPIPENAPSVCLSVSSSEAETLVGDASQVLSISKEGSSSEQVWCLSVTECVCLVVLCPMQCHWGYCLQTKGIIG